MINISNLKICKSIKNSDTLGIEMLIIHSKISKVVMAHNLAIVRLFAFLAILLYNQQALPMIVDEGHDMLGQWTWGSDYDDGYEEADSWAMWEAYASSQIKLICSEHFLNTNTLPNNEAKFTTAQEICRTEKFATLTISEKQACLDELHQALSKITITQEDQDYLFKELLKSCNLENQDSSIFALFGLGNSPQALFHQAYGEKTNTQILIQQMRKITAPFINFIKKHPNLASTSTAVLSGFLQFQYIIHCLNNTIPDDCSDLLLSFVCISIIPNIVMSYYANVKPMHCINPYLTGMMLPYIYFKYCEYLDQKKLNNLFDALMKRLCVGEITPDELMQYFQAIPGITSNDLNDVIKKLESEQLTTRGMWEYFQVWRYRRV